MTLDTNHPPPGPGPVRSLYELYRLRFGAMTHLQWLFARYGDVVRLRGTLTEDVVLAFHPDAVQRVLLDNNKNYPKGHRYRTLGLVLGEGLVNSEGPLWQRQRRLVQGLFNRDSVLALVPIIRRHADHLLGEWGETGERDLAADTARVTFNIAGEAFLGSAIERHADVVRENLTYALSVVLPRLLALVRLPMSWPLPTHIRFRRALARIDRAIYDIIDTAAAHRGPGAGDNVLTRLLNSVDPVTGERMDRRQLRDEVNTILMVGHETSGVSIVWCLYLLTQHPDVCRRLVEEIDRELGGAEPDADALPRLPYLNSVVCESLRVMPSIPVFPRQAAGDDHLCGLRVRSGSTVFICPWVTHRHPDFWPDGDRFDPARFDGLDPRSLHRCAYIPFGAGPRTCIGEFMTQLEVKILIIKILQRYSLALAPGFHPVCRGFISLQPVTGMRMVYQRREPAASVQSGVPAPGFISSPS
jgi:cytochrome P450